MWLSLFVAAGYRGAGHQLCLGRIDLRRFHVHHERRGPSYVRSVGHSGGAEGGLYRSLRDLLLGVSVGGLGTLIASMASVLSYRLYARAFPDVPYLGLFHKWNGLSLLVLGAAVFLLS